MDREKERWISGSFKKESGEKKRKERTPDLTFAFLFFRKASKGDSVNLNAVLPITRR